VRGKSGSVLGRVLILNPRLQFGREFNHGCNHLKEVWTQEVRLTLCFIECPRKDSKTSVVSEGTSRFSEKWSAPGSAFLPETAISGGNLEPQTPDYETQLQNIAAFDAELQTRRDIDGILNQFSESQLSSVLDFAKALSTQNLEACHEHD